MGEEENKIEITNESVGEDNKEFVSPVFLERNKLDQPKVYKEENVVSPKKPIVKRRKNIVKVITSLWVVAAAAVVGVVEADMVLPILSEKVDIRITYAEQTEAYYTIDFGDYKPKEELKLFLKNDFEDRELKVYYDNYYFEEFDRYDEADGGHQFFLEGYIDNLVPNMEYKLTLKDGSKTIGRTSFTANSIRYEESFSDYEYQEDSYWQEEQSVYENGREDYQGGDNFDGQDENQYDENPTGRQDYEYNENNDSAR